MKNLSIILVISILFSFSSIAQNETCDCKTDLDFLVEKMKKMPSYKKQIKGQKVNEFNKTYQELSTQMAEPILIESCYKLLLQQMLLVNDVHSGLSVTTEFLPNSVLEDAEKLEVFKNSDIYKNHPKTKRDITNLTAELEQKSSEHIEGIYNYGGKERIGIYYADNDKDLIGVVLETQLPQWETGEIRFYATHSSSNKYNFYYYNVNTRQPGMVKSLSFDNGRIWSYKKEGNTYNYEFVDYEDKIVDFKQIDEDTQYLYFKTFGNNYKKELVQFFKDTKDKITAKNVIVDLRSNRGGNSKYSDPFLKVLKNRNVYVITNCFAGSNGEQFTLKLLKNKKAIHLGQKTYGIIAYGNNYGRSYTSPSGLFEMTPTDMNFHKYIEYEGKGIQPEIVLDFNSDWIEQTLEIINSKYEKS